MRYVLNKISKNMTKTVFKMMMFFIVFFMLFVAIFFNDANKKIEDYLFKTIGINIVLYGDINDYEYNGYVDDLDTYNKIYSTIKDTASYIEENKLGVVNFEQGLHCSKVISAQNINDDTFYEMVLYNVNQGDSFLNTVSKDINNNRHYLTSMERFYQDPNFDEPLGFINDSFYSVLIGVNQSEFSDLKLHYMNIVMGRSFSREEIDEGKMVAVVNSQAYLLDRNNISNIKIGDTIPITVTYGDRQEVFEFEVIGINDGGVEGLSIQDTYTFEKYAYTSVYPQSYSHNVYIPNKCFDKIRQSLLNLYSNADKKPTKQNNGNEEAIYYGQYGGIRPLVITVDSLDRYFEVLSYIKNVNKKLNDLSNRVIEYTYFTNLDRFSLTISSINTNKELFRVACAASVLVTAALFIVFILNDIEDYKKDIAICIVLGNSKKRMILQVLWEYLLLGAFPCILAFSLSNYLVMSYVSNMNMKLIDISSSSIFTDYVSIIDVKTPAFIKLLPILIVFISLLIACAISYLKLSLMSTYKILTSGE